jgi:two-component system sensor histidine kinase UhpB
LQPVGRGRCALRYIEPRGVRTTISGWRCVVPFGPFRGVRPAPLRLRALIVEDQLDDRELIVRELTAANFILDCEFVDTAAAFSAALASSHWDVVLSDFSVPGFGAAAALALLKASELVVPFIVVSGLISDDEAAALMRLGARDCVNKQHLHRLAPAIERELKDGKNRREAGIDRDVLLQQLQLQIDRMPIGYVLLDAQLRITDWNRAAQDILGFTRDEVRGLGPPYHLIVPESADLNIELILERLRRGEMDAESINENLTKDGRRVLCHWFNTPLFDSAGAFTGLLSMMQDVTAQQQSQRDLLARTEQLRALTASQTLARENESRRVARELHDELGSSLTTIKWELDKLAAAIAGPIGDSAATALRVRLARLAVLAQSTMGAVQRIAAELRPGVLDDLGLAEALEWQALEFCKRTHIRCDCDCAVGDAVFTNDQATTLFRIMQEALTNIVRHAAASLVRVSLTGDEGAFVLRIEDNGRGVSPSDSGAPTALGLLGMQERAALIGATLTVSGQAGKGTVVSVRLPHASVVPA